MSTLLNCLNICGYLNVFARNIHFISFYDTFAFPPQFFLYFPGGSKAICSKWMCCQYHPVSACAVGLIFVEIFQFSHIIRPTEGIPLLTILSSYLLRESIWTNQLCYVKSSKKRCLNIGWKGKWFNKSLSPEPWCPKFQFITTVPNNPSNPNIIV